ncbi:MAG: glycosyltransferase family 39 protein [Planctomycetaceae bacterium]|nr:glycosyltransferase family 39 protein [Planctomycetaceae bacterium]
MMPSRPIIDSSPTTDRHRRWMGVFLVVGLLMRCSRYLMHFPMWEDECFLSVNFIDRSYGELLAPLQYHQVAPVLFLWIELTAVKLFGYHEFALRFFAFASSLAGLFLFVHLARRLLSGSALVLAVGLFAVSYPNMRYAAEAKQYASDMLVGLIFLTMCVEWWLRYRAESPEVRRRAGHWLLILVLFTPIGVALSYPAVFSAGAVSLFVAWTLWQQSRTAEATLPAHLRSLLASREGRTWVSFNLILLGSFAGVLFITAKGQTSAELGFMSQYWQDAFPPIRDLATLPGWFLETHCGPLLAFPLGGNNYASSFTTICFAIGIVALIRNNRALCWLLLTPVILHLIAAGLQRYPYGGHFKFSMHMAGIICLLSGWGSAILIETLGRLSRTQRYSLAIASAYLLAVASGIVIRDIRSPYKTESDMRARAFAQWFWFSGSFAGETACVENDLGIIFSPDAHRELSWQAMYQVNKAIYDPSQPNAVNSNEITRRRPLRCVIYRDPKFDFDEQKFDSWLTSMQSDYELVSTDRFPFPRFEKYETRNDPQFARKIDYVEIYQFTPRSDRNRYQLAEEPDRPKRR